MINEAKKKETEFINVVLKKDDLLKQMGDLYVEIKELQTVKKEIEKQASEYYGALKVL